MADLTGMLQAAAGAGGEEPVNPNAWDITKAVYEASTGAWDLSKAYYSRISFPVATQEGTPQGGFFKSDGTKMYVLGSTGDDVNEYSLSTPWVVSTASYVQNFSVSAQESNPTDLFFKSDGTKMYVVGASGDDVNEYTLSTAWDISSASYVQSFSVATEETAPQGLFFKPDGTKMYVIGTDGDDVNEYDLSSAWDISTASYVQNFSVSAQESNPYSLSFKPDGTKMYVIGTQGEDINEYDLSTPWDVSSASYVQNLSFSSSTEDVPLGIYFKEDGSMFFLVGSGADRVYQYVFGAFSVSAQESSPEGISFKPDGTKMYVIGDTGNDVNEYSLSTAWDITTASYVQNFSVGTQDGGPRSLFFKPDGTKMYFAGVSNDRVYEYNLSTAWDVSSASYVQNFSVSAQDGVVTGLFFKPDGTKMYIVGVGQDTVFQYSLSSAWDVSTASYDSVSFSINAQENNPQDLSFKTDGTKMYIIGTQGDDINEYDLSTPWDVSSASFVQSLPILDSEPKGIYWRDNGEEFFIVGDTNDHLVTRYKISSE